MLAGRTWWKLVAAVATIGIVIVRVVIGADPRKAALEAWVRELDPWEDDQGFVGGW